MLHSLRCLPLAIALAACGGGGGSSDDPAPVAASPSSATPAATARSGRIVGLQGVSWKSGSLSGITGDDGDYQWQEGQPITFSVGGIVLGTVTGAETLTLSALAGHDAQVLENLTRLLVTLDYDLAPMNGVTITASIREAAVGKSLNLKQSADAFKAAAEVLLQAPLASDLHVHAHAHGVEHLLPAIYAQREARAQRAGLKFSYPKAPSALLSAPGFDAEANAVFDLMLADTTQAGNSPLEYIFKATNVELVRQGSSGSLKDLYALYKARVANIGEDAPMVEREDFLTRPSAPVWRNVQHFAVMSDFQMRDDESPLNVNPLKFLIASSYYPASPSIPFQVDDMVHTLRRYERDAGKAIEMAIFTGDFTDISQYNEVRWGIDVLDGNLVNPDSGADDDPIAGRFPDGSPNDTYDAFDARGLNAQQSGEADIPWYYVSGNHDGLMLGNFPITDRPLSLFGKNMRGGTREFFDSISTGSRNWLGYDPSLLGFLQHLFNPASFKIDPDADRRVASQREIAEEFFNSTSTPLGHGMQNVINRGGNLEQKLHYTFTSQNGLVKHITLDTNMPIGPEGWLDLNDIAWLQSELRAAETAGQLVIVSSHHKPQHTVLNGALLVNVLNNSPNVIAHLVAHTHINKVVARRGSTAARSYWEIESGSMVNWPQQFRMLDIQVDVASGTGVIRSTMLNHEAASPLHVSQRGRFLAYLERYLEGKADPEASLTSTEGTARDRNVNLYFQVPPGVLARLSP